MLAFAEDSGGLKDRGDALVWALHWLLLEHAGAVPRLMRL
jgi:phage terminase large subunit-like protein